ncbi:hypothetical protein KEM48_011957 [Puccinia striiformis f. sp. tritici PST-130]|nr:hypothetical protein KEM48_011957 [Puccinia striiformis f. sp. tritici PST-130]
MLRGPHRAAARPKAETCMTYHIQVFCRTTCPYLPNHWHLQVRHGIKSAGETRSNRRPKLSAEQVHGQSGSRRGRSGDVQDGETGVPTRPYLPEDTAVVEQSSSWGKAVSPNAKGKRFGPTIQV